MRRRSDLDVSAEHARTLVNADEAKARARMNLRHVETNSCVDDCQTQLSRLLDQKHFRVPAPAVFGDVGQTFLAHAEEREGCFFGQAGAIRGSHEFYGEIHLFGKFSAK